MLIPRGRLLIIGGAEDKGDTGRLEMAEKNKEFRSFEILETLIPERRSSYKRVEIIPTASNEPRAAAEGYVDVFKDLDFDDVDVMYIENREDANCEEFIRRVEDAHAVLFTGGNQFRLSTILGGTRLIKSLQKKYEDTSSFILAGTSAGAMAMAKTMIYEGQGGEAMIKDALKTTAGLGFLDFCIIDTHFIKRGRFPRLAQAVITNPNCVGIGLGEDTALLVSEGNRMECFGSGMVIIVDGYEVKHSNIAYASPGTPVCVEHFVVHVLARGNEFLLQEREFIPARKDLDEERRA